MSQIIELLKNLNLPQDKISLNLIQFFHEHLVNEVLLIVVLFCNYLFFITLPL